MLRVGLTGGIASGKTTAAQFMAEMGCHVIAADQLAHSLMEPGGEAYDEIIKEFGRQILLANGRIDRNRLGAIVFSDRARLARLNQITHPRVTALILLRLNDLDRSEASRSPGIVVIEAALLVEAGFHRHVDQLIVVDCGREQQIARLTERGFSREQAEARLAAQMSFEEKRRYAQYVVDSSGSKENTRLQVERIVQELRSLAAAQPARSRSAGRKGLEEVG